MDLRYAAPGMGSIAASRTPAGSLAFSLSACLLRAKQILFILNRCLWANDLHLALVVFILVHLPDDAGRVVGSSLCTFPSHGNSP